jgi:hypothetical protein
MLNNSELSDHQKSVLSRFYSASPSKVSFDKRARSKISKKFAKDRNIPEIENLKKEIPSFHAEIERAILSERNIQSAVFSECVYAQELARIYKLINFDNNIKIGKPIVDFSHVKNSNLPDLTIRYSYYNSEKNEYLFQAGGAGGVDCALFSKFNNSVAMIEFKEPYAKTSEPNLPKYGEDGLLKISDGFSESYPQLVPMLEEHIAKGLNAFEHLGRNVSEFDANNIETAVRENYSGSKYADFICTEDRNGVLVMLLAKDVSKWAALEGEIRPSGRNHSDVWTPERLDLVLRNKKAKITDLKVEMDISSFKTSNGRGSSSVSRFKIDPAFFVFKDDVVVHKGNVSFEISSIRQLIPSISAKMNFKNLKHSEVKEYYSETLK